MQSISEAKVAEFLQKNAVQVGDVPSVQAMVERASIADGTPYQRWAEEALTAAMAFHQAAHLDRMAKLAMQDPRAALDQIQAVESGLSYLRACVIFEAARNLKQQAQEGEKLRKKLLAASPQLLKPTQL